ncbi:hypothetical protein [Paenibacillus sp. S29]|uniref:hypothetical protein n=1 Tax=Paenibacillus sp. S29 TaxID=3394611 RepID=UPI0039BF5BE5
MELAVQSWAFNPNLRWMRARISGNDEGGNEIDVNGTITDIKGDYLEFEFIREGQNNTNSFLSGIFPQRINPGCI